MESCCVAGSSASGSLGGRALCFFPPFGSIALGADACKVVHLKCLGDFSVPIVVFLICKLNPLFTGAKQSSSTVEAFSFIIAIFTPGVHCKLDPLCNQFQWQHQLGSGPLFFFHPLWLAPCLAAVGLQTKIFFFFLASHPFCDYHFSIRRHSRVSVYSIHKLNIVFYLLITNLPTDNNHLSMTLRV